MARVNFCKDWIARALDDPAYSWDWNALSYNPNLTWQHVAEHMDRPWNWSVLSRFEEVSFEFLLDREDTNWTIVSEYTTRFALETSDGRSIPWEWSYLTINPNLKWQWIEKAVASGVSPQEFSNMLSKSPCVTLEIVLANPEFSWNWHRLSANPNFTVDMALAHPDLPWSWPALSQNASTTLDKIERYPKMPWDHIYLSLNPNLTPEFMQKHSEFEWAYSWMSYSGCLTDKFIKKFPKAPWCWEKIIGNKKSKISWKHIGKHIDAETKMRPLSQNPAVTMEIVRSNPDIGWCPKGLSSNPNVNLTDVVSSATIIKWDWELLSKNPNMLTVPHQVLEREARRRVAARRIWHGWRRASDTPGYQIWQKRMLSEFTQLKEEVYT